MKVVNPMIMQPPIISAATEVGAPYGMPRVIMASQAKIALGLVTWMP